MYNFVLVCRSLGDIANMISLGPKCSVSLCFSKEPVKKALPPSLTICRRLLCWSVLLEQSTPLSLRLKIYGLVLWL